MPQLRKQRLIGEFLIIVLGVLAALAVDQWRQGAQERALEVEYLVRLERDLLRDSASAATTLDGTNRGRASLDRALELIDTSGVLDSVGTYVSVAVGAPPPLATQPTFDELLSTGSLRLIRDLETREAILAYYERSSYALEQIYAVRDRGHDDLVDFMWDLEVPSARGPATAEPLESRFLDPAFRTALVRGMRWLDQQQRFGEYWRGAIDSALTVLRRSP